MLLLVALVAAPTLMVAATVAERRFGPHVAGWVVAAPTTIVVALIAVGAGLGRHAAATLARSAAEHVGVQVAFAVVFAALLLRRRPVLGLLLATLLYAVGSLVVVSVPEAIAVAASLIALVIGPRFLFDDPAARMPSAGSNRDTAIRGLVAAIAVGAVLAVAQVVGPALAGATAAYPVMSSTLALLIYRSNGPAFAAHALRGLCRGLPAYLGFCLTASVLVPRVGVVVAVVAALGVCSLSFRLTWRLVQPGGGPQAVEQS